MTRARRPPSHPGDPAAPRAGSNRPALDADAYAQLRATVLARDGWRCRRCQGVRELGLSAEAPYETRCASCRDAGGVLRLCVP